MKQAVLITGGTGFAGSHLVEALLDRGVPAENIHVTSFGGHSSLLDSLIPQENVHQVDLTQVDQTNHLFEKLQPSQIYHLASFASPGKSLENMRRTLHNNTELQINVLEAMKHHAPRARLLCVCSATEYAESSTPLDEKSLLGPNNPYGVSKVIQDMLAHSYTKQFDLDIVRVRPFNHIGERQQPGFVMSDFAQQIVEIEKGNQPPQLKVGNLKVWRDFSDVKDVVQAYMVVMEKGKKGEVYNIGSGKMVLLEDVLQTLASLSRKKFEIQAEAARQRSGEAKKVEANIDRIKALGWKPSIPLEETFIRILKYWRQKNKEHS